MTTTGRSFGIRRRASALDLIGLITTTASTAAPRSCTNASSRDSGVIELRLTKLTA
jgi:hypothetical protein